ncbi:MAG: 16S rRNA (adenine(1518)-N(6)/adenine(1519)-N(6))-dimethyltransferase RsmA [Acidimicrobiia bacterium]|nr:16S rRNA (adenine(1518)-N(6)/adenine(1519)-N(6))-dimethyltransferase RsmA [Acidimicrobiia bacterium]
MRVTHSRRALLDLLDRHHLAPSRALGQNFVADANTVRRIARLAAVGPGDRVVEIGAGLGSLTLALADTGAAVTAVEVDRYVLPVLRDVVAGRDIRVVEADARDIDWTALLVEGCGDTGAWVLVANLPYNVATTLVLDVAERAPRVGRMLVLVQREVAERLAASPGGRDYGLPSAKLGWWAEARLVGTVPASVFVPRPRVESALLAVARHEPLGGAAERRATFRLVDAAFGQRRKMLRRSLAGVVPPAAFEAAAVDPAARAEQLGPRDWLRLSGATAQLADGAPC